MLGSSRESLTTLRASLDARRGDAGFASVSDDLLAVAGVLGGEKTLRQTLADSGQPVELRRGVATSLFEGKIAAPSFAILSDVVSARWSHDADLVGDTASPATTALLAHAAGNLRGRRPAAAVEELARLASEQRRQVLAQVRSAIPLDTDQHSRLAAALTRLQGRQVRVNVIVDPEVVGGIVVRVGDDVIDGSVSARLEQARRALSA